MNLFEVSKEFGGANRIFLRNGHGRRPVYGGEKSLSAATPLARPHPCTEYFHADNGAGLGASHRRDKQVGGEDNPALWISRSPEKMLEVGKGAKAPFRGKSKGEVEK